MTRFRAARQSVFVTLAVSSGILACRPTDVPRHRAPLAVSDVEPEYRDDWRDVVRAQSTDPASDEVVAAANRLLGRNPPADLRAAALLAKAQQAFLIDADDRAIRWSEEGRAAAVEGSADAAVHTELWRVSVSALARGGDPDTALAAIDRARAEADVPTVELRGARAIALERRGDPAPALVGFAAWRELLDAGTPEAAYAERRFAALASAVHPKRLRGLANEAESPAVGACLRAAAGEALPSVSGDWTGMCRRLPTRVGVLLPRSGSLSGLADRHLAAVTAGVSVLEREREVELLWEDAGSDPSSTQAAARRLLGRGAEVVVGPVGRANVSAATRVLDPVLAVLPGEPSDAGLGVAPTLEARASALMQVAQHRGRAVAVLAPDNGYGRRAVAGLARDHGAAVRFYPPDTTTFKPYLEPSLARLQKGGSIIVLDAMPRFELIVRQIRSMGVALGDGRDQALVLGSGEGLSTDALSSGRDVFDTVVLAPVAAPGPNSTPFENEYLRQQGRAADDQALLVWRALAGVWSGTLPHGSVSPELVRVRGAELVPFEATK